MVRASVRTVGAGICPALALVLATGVSAQEVKTEPLPGEIILSRQVEYRAIGSPNVPGAISTVDVGPDELILSSIGAGLSPITDGEAAEIASGPQTGGIINQTLATGLAAIDDTHSAGSFSPSESAGSSISGTINQALGAIPSAMSALQGALGGDQ